MRVVHVAVGIALVGSLATAQEHDHGAGGKLGTVHFSTSCARAAQPTFDRAVSLLHSFDFQRAIDEFNRTLVADPSCAMAHWGIALSRWNNPFAPGIRPAAQVESGRQTIDRAVAANAKTDRERAYIDAASRLYANATSVNQPARVAAYRDAMAAVADHYQADAEASIFYALALAFAADPADATYRDQLKGGAILDRLFLKYPDHPGLAHYIIHTYDVPPLASRALEPARRYARIAPAAPHALHMPSHTFTRVGYWQESIDTNIAAAKSARAQAATGEELHATDYEMYAYLQMGRDGAAARLVEALPEIVARYDPTRVVGSAPPAAAYFAIAAIPARYAIERSAWHEAARLEAHPSPFAYTDAITYFARALGAARAGDAGAARSDLAVLDGLRRRLADEHEAYWANQVDIQQRGASAWVAYAEHRTEEALAELRSAAEREDATEKSAVTPGPLAPARELLGDMLVAAGRPEQAFTEYTKVLAKEPNRFRSLYGAGRAAALAGSDSAAREHFAALIKTCAKADEPARAELADARQRFRKK